MGIKKLYHYMYYLYYQHGINTKMVPHTEYYAASVISFINYALVVVFYKIAIINGLLSSDKESLNVIANMGFSWFILVSFLNWLYFIHFRIFNKIVDEYKNMDESHCEKHRWIAVVSGVIIIFLCFMIRIA
ncbi:MAG: hypothetical protein K8F24_08705 [Bacteroidales bacterium]|nr:hypothetical protein [Bacteroidales bacterium]